MKLTDKNFTLSNSLYQIFNTNTATIGYTCTEDDTNKKKQNRKNK